MKVIVPHFTTLFDFYSAKYSFANYSFVVILLRILQFPQNTENVRSCYANYNLKCCAKYSFSEKLLRKIQKLLLRKIQIFQKLLCKIQDRMLRLLCANYKCCAKYNKPLYCFAVSFLPLYLRFED